MILTQYNVEHYIVFQPMVRVRESPTCAICEFVMKQLESMLEDQATEVGCVLTISLIK